MPERKPNQFARVFAVLALVLALVVVVFTLATTDNSSNSDEGGDESGETTESGPTAKGERAVEEGVWIVGEGDTLVSISEDTATDLDELVELNPDIDPQTLSTGQRVALRSGLGEADSGLDNSGESDGIPGN